MKKASITCVALLFAVGVFSQQVLRLSPDRVVPLDFSSETQAKWKQRDEILKALSEGKKDYKQLTTQESELLENYPEVFEDIWDIVGGGCSWYCAGGPKAVTASSALKAQGKNSYEAKNAHDLNYKTAWVEGKSDYGVGEFLLYTFAGGSPRITEIIVVNGYVKNKEAWQNNSRVKTLNMYIDNKLYAVLNLKDEIAEQSFSVEPIGNRTEGDQKAKDWTIKFEIVEVYPGSRWKDTVISEIYFDGLDVH